MRMSALIVVAMLVSAASAEKKPADASAKKIKELHQAAGRDLAGRVGREFEAGPNWSA